MKKTPIKKKPTNPRKKLIAQLDRVFSLYIRKRDSVNGKNTCFTCGKISTIAEMDAGHFMLRDRAATRYSEINVQPQCRSCNRFKNGKQFEFGIALDEKYGEGTAKELIEKSHTIRKYTIQELDELIAYYKNKEVNHE